MRLLPTLALVLCTGCSAIELLWPEEEPPPNCELRTAYYPDQDGDGVGSDSSVFIGCEAPSGYVEQAGDSDDSDPTVIECPDTAPGPDDTADSA